MAKAKKIEKETRRLIESISDVVKHKGDRYKFKSKNKKTIKKIKRNCVHWLIRKDKTLPTVELDQTRTDYWKCGICGATFPVVPYELSRYLNATDQVIEMVNQIQFWAVRLGGDKDDTKMFLRLRNDLPRFQKVTKGIIKMVNKRQAWDKNRENSDAMSQFSMYSGFNYRP